MAYKHGAYGEITDSRVKSTAKSEVVVGYIGTAPVNLVRGYAGKDLINRPIKITNMSDAQNKLGYSSDWKCFTICEAFAEHFDNKIENVGPIFVVNVLDPDEHKSDSKTTKELTFFNRRAEFESSEIILDTFAIADKVEGIDYSLEYNFKKGTVVVRLYGDGTIEKLTASFETVDITKVDKTDIIGKATEDGQYMGLYAMKLLYQYYDATLNILAAPGWSHIPEIYKAMVAIVQKLNGHWDGFVNADIPLMDEDGNKIDTMSKAEKWTEANGYNSEYSKVYWPQVKDENGRIFHLSTVGSATMLRVDLSHNGVPFESPSNKEIMATSQYFGEESTNRGFDQESANELNQHGITTACYWAARWVLWGPHTAAYTYGGNMDVRAVFDVNIRMLEYITNSFQQDHGTEIDQPMTPQDQDAILNAEKERLDTLMGLGALIGNPTVEFVETSNPTSDMMNGDFVWDFAVTNTPPMKSATARVCYTDEGFQAFFATD